MKRHTGRWKGGYSVVLTTSMMLAAVAVMGSSLLYWANVSFENQRENAAKVFHEESDVLKENLVVEDVWWDVGAPRYVNVTLRNVGNIVINVTKLSLNGTVVWNQGAIVASGADVTIYAGYSWSNGVYTLKVETERGSVLSGVWKATE